jgi:hypothetical protein
MRILFFAVLFFGFITKCSAVTIELYPPGLSERSSAGKINLVFCAVRYDSQDEFVKDVGVAFSRLKQTKPFNEFDLFNFWYLVLTPDEEKTVFIHTDKFPPINFRMDFLNAIRGHLRTEYKLVVFDAKGNVPCAELSRIEKFSAIIIGKSRSSNPDAFAKSFLHELGHGFGLRDECPNCEKLCDAGIPNCAGSLEEAKSWWHDMVGKEPNVDYIHGCCGNTNFIRPTIASLMNNPDQALTFGPVNERYMRQELSKIGKTKEKVLVNLP